MKTILKSMMVVLVALLSVHASAYEQIGGIYYILHTSTKTATVTYGTNQYTGSVTIPSSISDNGVSYSVTSIGSYAFSNCSNVTSVTIPNSVTSIGQCAFNKCISLTSVAIPNSVTSIGSTAFYGCSSLKSVHINNLAAWCSINFEYEVGMGPFQYTYHLYLNGQEIKDLIIPNSVIEIGDGAFHNCIGLTSVTIHNSVTKIGNGAFDGCSGLTSVTIPNSVTEIGHGAFLYCSMLTSVTISNSIMSIGNRTFDGCINLTSVTIPNSVTEIKAYAFRGCIKLTSVTIPNSVTELYYGAFQDCRKLTSVVAETETPPSFVGLDVFSGISSTCVLTVPYGTKDSYIAAGWSEYVFKGGIIEMEEIKENVSLSQQGIRTFSSPYELDFTNSTIKAYIASGFSPSTGDLILTRVYNVPAGEGLLLKGEAGDYEVPCATTDMVYSNLLKGVVTATNVSPTDGGNTNFILANGSHGIGFYTLSEEGEIGAGKAYLQLPTSSISTSAMSRSINLLFDDEEEKESTELTEMENVQSSANEYFDLQGRQVPAESVKSGIYIIRSANGGKEKKVFIK